jgi:hypothetical protein
MVRVNFTDTEKYGKSSIGRDPLPSGKYHVAITDIEVRQSGPEAKFPGVDYWNMEFTVQDGPYQGQKCWTNVTFLEHALYTLKGIMEALGMETTGWDGEVDEDDFINRELIVRVVFRKAGKIKDRNGEYRDVDDRNEVKGFYPLSSGTGNQPAKAGSGAVKGGTLLP